MSEKRIRDVERGDDSIREVAKRPTRALVCRSCKARIEAESGYDKCPRCGAAGSELLQESRVRDTPEQT